VIAAPLAGRTLAAHGADVLWITSPNLPDLPGLDRDFARGKRTAQLDLNKPEDKSRLTELIKDADVFLQSYRPGALASKGFGPEAVRKINPNIIYAT
jgi:crotonobetainyl-CoA:carnitine CoA-transferase CaiB-like acyl-CoA transferase